MAKSRKKNYYSKKRTQRRYQYIPKAENLLSPLHKEIYYVKQDRRRFNPNQAYKKSHPPTRQPSLSSFTQSYSKQIAHHFKPNIPRPDDVLRRVVCRRRQLRRKILFAITKIGKGKGGGAKRRRITEDSKIKC